MINKERNSLSMSLYNPYGGTIGEEEMERKGKEETVKLKRKYEKRKSLKVKEVKEEVSKMLEELIKKEEISIEDLKDNMRSIGIIMMICGMSGLMLINII